MAYFITTFGILYVIIGVVLFMKPEYIRAILDFSKVGKRPYIFCAVRIIIGALLIYAAQSALLPWIPRIVGILAVLGGTITYFIGLQRVYALMEWYKNLSDNRLRIFAALAEAVGILLVYSA